MTERLQMVVGEAEEPDAFVVKFCPPWWVPLYSGICIALHSVGLLESDSDVMARFITQHTRVWSRAGREPWRYEGKAMVEDAS